MAITAGMYELRSVLLETMCVTGSGYTPVTGSNTFLYAWNDGNNRKYTFTQEPSGKWLLRNVANGLYMAAARDVGAEGLNVIQWTLNVRDQLRWNVTETGDTVEIDGYTCPVVTVGSYITADGATWMLDVDRAMTTNSTNMELNSASAADSQRFALMPTASLNNSYPVPGTLGWVRNTANNPYVTHADASVTNMKLGWIMPDTWAPDAARGYERRVRSRYMSAETSAWGEWGTWEEWADVDPFERDKYCYDLNPVDASFDTSTYKAREVQAEVRCKTAAAHGRSVSRVLRNIVDPSVTFTSDSASAEGFIVNLSSDYAPAYYTIVSLELDGVELLSSPVELQMLGGTETLTIPWANLAALGDLPDGGETATAKYTRGTDLFARIGGGATKTAQLTLDYGPGPRTEPTITDGAGLTLDVTHPDGIIGVWVSTGGAVYASEDGTGIVYPFGEPFEMLVAVGDGTMYHATMPPQDAKPCHAFNWDGGSFLLQVANGFMQTSRKISADFSDYQLNSRPWHSLKFGGNLDGDFTAVGALKDGFTASTKADLMALMRAHHVIYRAPSGEVANVGVTDAQYVTIRDRTEVTVTMQQETI